MIADAGAECDADRAQIVVGPLAFASMGQLVGVTEKPSATRGVVRFETNRTISGLGHEQFSSVADAYGNTPTDELARRLFATGQVAAVHVYGNIVTVDLVKGHDSTGLADVVRDLYQYWHPGMEPPSFEDLEPDEPEAAASGGGDGTVAVRSCPRLPSVCRAICSTAVVWRVSAGTPSRAEIASGARVASHRVALHLIGSHRIPSRVGRAGVWRL